MHILNHHNTKVNINITLHIQQFIPFNLTIIIHHVRIPDHHHDHEVDHVLEKEIINLQIEADQVRVVNITNIKIADHEADHEIIDLVLDPDLSTDHDLVHEVDDQVPDPEVVHPLNMTNVIAAAIQGTKPKIVQQPIPK